MFYQIIIFFAIFYSTLSLHPDPEKTLPKTNNIIFKTSDGGTTWDDVSAGLPQKFDVWSIYATKEDVFLGYEKGLYRTSVSNSIPSWQKEIFINQHVNTLSSGQSGPYVSSYDNGFFQKLPGTGAWISVYPTFPEKTVRTILETKRGDIFVGCDRGIFKSADKGKTWNLVFTDVMVTSLVEMGDVVLGCTSNGILRSVDKGNHWEPVLTEDGPTKSIKIIDGQLFAISFGVRSEKDVAENTNTASNTIRSSVDGGKTWKHAFKNLTSFQYMFRLEDKQSPVSNINDIAAFDKSIFCSLEKGVYRSDDHGKNWELVLPSIENSVFELAVAGNMVYAVKVFRGC
jgi:BNR/Asp-box repeat